MEAEHKWLAAELEGIHLKVQVYIHGNTLHFFTGSIFM